jgi:DNA-binding NarL/FixJ family response regulator
MTSQDDRTTILVVDDHALVREGLREILQTQTDMRVVGEAGDSATTVALAGREQPHIVLLDVGIPGGEVTSTVQQIRSRSPGSGVLILSMYEGPQLVQALLAAGIRGYLLKSIHWQELVVAIRAIRTDSKRVVLGVSSESLRYVRQRPSPGTLSAREREVLALVAEALSNGQIASRLRLTEATVKRHLRNIFVKLGAVSRIDAVNKAAEFGMLDPIHGCQSPVRPASLDTSHDPFGGLAPAPLSPLLLRRVFVDVVGKIQLGEEGEHLLPAASSWIFLFIHDPGISVRPLTCRLMSIPEPFRKRLPFDGHIVSYGTDIPGPANGDRLDELSPLPCLHRMKGHPPKEGATALAVSQGRVIDQLGLYFCPVELARVFLAARAGYADQRGPAGSSVRGHALRGWALRGWAGFGGRFGRRGRGIYPAADQLQHVVHRAQRYIGLPGDLA